ncbi:MAG: helix-turn-helix domain-containing protein [Clostridia bacterium]|nr:helix-turn-helix domain-containing protein [Clostridia bacterium]
MAETIRISIDQINPCLRFINLFQSSRGFNSGLRKLYDYYFLYVHSGKGKVIINSREYNLVSGNLVFCPPHVENQIIADEEEPFILTGINFDFTDHFIDSPYIYPINADLFDEAKITEYVQFTDFEGFRTLLNFQHDEKLRQLILDMIHIFEAKKRYWKVHLNGLLKTFIARVVEQTSQHEFDVTTANKYDEILDYISLHYNTEITNVEIAGHFHYNPDYINKIIFSYTGLTIKQYIIDLRIRKAINLLINSNMTINEISEEVGCSTTNYFSKLFKKKTGFSPALFRDNINL